MFNRLAVTTFSQNYLVELELFIQPMLPTVGIALRIKPLDKTVWKAELQALLFITAPMKACFVHKDIWPTCSLTHCTALMTHFTEDVSEWLKSCFNITMHYYGSISTGLQNPSVHITETYLCLSASSYSMTSLQTESDAIIPRWRQGEAQRR